MVDPDASTSGVRSSEPSSITTIRRRVTASRAAASTLSRIVTSSFSAGTRKTQVSAVGAAWARRARAGASAAARTNRSAVQSSIAHDDGEADPEEDGPADGRPEKGAVSSSRARRPRLAASLGRSRSRCWRVSRSIGSIWSPRPAAADRPRGGCSRSRTGLAASPPRTQFSSAATIRRPRVRRRRGSGRRRHLRVSAAVGQAAPGLDDRSAPGRCRPASSVPASTPSLRSVVSRVTSTGLPSDGASSWMPPESVITM